MNDNSKQNLEIKITTLTHSMLFDIRMARQQELLKYSL